MADLASCQETMRFLAESLDHRARALHGMIVQAFGEESEIGCRWLRESGVQSMILDGDLENAISTMKAWLRVSVGRPEDYSWL